MEKFSRELRIVQCSMGSYRFFLFFVFFEKSGNDPSWDLGSGIATVFSLIPVTRDLGVLERCNRRHMHYWFLHDACRY